MAITDNELRNLIVEQRVVVSDCEGSDHSPDSAGCLCELKGTTQVVGRRYESVYVGTPTWYLEGTGKRARLSELTLIPAQEPAK